MRDHVGNAIQYRINISKLLKQSSLEQRALQTKRNETKMVPQGGNSVPYVCITNSALYMLAHLGSYVSRLRICELLAYCEVSDEPGRDVRSGGQEG